MQTDCTPDQIEFQGFGRRRVVGQFDAGRTSSDGGVVLLREVEERTGWLRRFASCFRDGRAAYAASHIGCPVLGVKVGRMGFLTEVEPADALPLVRAVFAGRARVEERLALTVEPVSGAGEPARGLGGGRRFLRRLRLLGI